MMGPGYRKTRMCPQCCATLPIWDFRRLRGTRDRRYRLCEMCEKRATAKLLLAEAEAIQARRRGERDARNARIAVGRAVLGEKE